MFTRSYLADGNEQMDWERVLAGEKGKAVAWFQTHGDTYSATPTFSSPSGLREFSGAAL